MAPRDIVDEDLSSEPSKKKAKSAVKFKKAPQAPRRFKSAYMFFSTAKHPEIRERLRTEGKPDEKTTHIAKLVSAEWKALPKDEREKWDKMAREDKARFEVEKTMYTGPWKVPANKRSQKDPSAPKRPMSSFLSFSNSKRASTKQQYPEKTNAEISRILAEMWKDAPEEERQVHIEKEAILREEYKVAMAEWKKNAEDELNAQRQAREDAARKAAANQMSIESQGVTLNLNAMNVAPQNTVSGMNMSNMTGNAASNQFFNFFQQEQQQQQIEQQQQQLVQQQQQLAQQQQVAQGNMLAQQQNHGMAPGFQQQQFGQQNPFGLMNQQQPQFSNLAATPGFVDPASGLQNPTGAAPTFNTYGDNNNGAVGTFGVNGTNTYGGFGGFQNQQFSPNFEGVVQMEQFGSQDQPMVDYQMETIAQHHAV